MHIKRGNPLRERVPSRGGRPRPNPNRNVATRVVGGQIETQADGNAAAYRFLLTAGIDRKALDLASVEAERAVVPLHKALLAGGLVGDDTYTRLVARANALEVVDFAQRMVFEAPALVHARARLHPVRFVGRMLLVTSADTVPPDRIWELAAFAARDGRRLCLMPRRAYLDAVERSERGEAERHAIYTLLKSRPDLSAATRAPDWQLLTIAVLAGVVIGGAVVLPGWTLTALLLALTVPFMAVVAVRLMALGEVVWPSRLSADFEPVGDGDLPTYSVLVPVFDEADVIQPLTASLARLDYPASKVEIILVLEEVDLKTKAALLGMTLPGNMRAVVVPDSQPRTKPKALNYAMRFASGEFVVVFDAEDRPDPDQLRRAIAMFRAGPDNLACVQARLNIYNSRESWFTRQFTVEYSALFDAILPALARLGFPVPLGGTSNHFPRALLEEVLGWDPYNVTEDADLGIRLARMGYVTQVLPSTTWEEAPRYFGQWLRQRTRWLKGWMQTYLVHMRHPRRLFRELGFLQGLGFHVFLGGLILSALVHPVIYLVVGWNAVVPSARQMPNVLGALPFAVSLFTLAAGYLSAIGIGVIAVGRRGHPLIVAALQMPLCWLLISFAAYRALWQLWRDPFLWEKTAHGRAPAKPTRG